MRRKFYFLMLLSVLAVPVLIAQTNITVAPGDNLWSAIVDAAAGDTIVLKAGMYAVNDSSFIIDKDINIRAETSTKPVLYISQFDVLGEDVDIYIAGIHFSGAGVDPLTWEEDLDELAGDYFLNLHSDLVSAGEIKVEDCIIRNLNRSIVRGDRSAYTVGDFIFNNLVVFDLRGGGDYGPFRLKSKITFDTFTLTNSTFYNFLNKLIDNQDTPSHPMDFLIKNCTFYKWGGGKNGQYLFDIEDNDQARLIIQDCIFGKTNDDPVADPPLTVNGWRYMEDAYLEMITTAMTPDFALTSGTYEEVVWDKSEYNLEDVDPDWADPEAGNFRLPAGSDLLESSQTGEIIGDPRWHPDFTGIKQASCFSKISIYPNPADRVFYLELPEASLGAQVSVYNSLGAMVKQFSNVHSDEPLKIAELAPGMYFVQVGAEKANTIKLIVK